MTYAAVCLDCLYGTVVPKEEVAVGWADRHARGSMVRARVGTRSHEVRVFELKVDRMAVIGAEK